MAPPYYELIPSARSASATKKLLHPEISNKKSNREPALTSAPSFCLLLLAIAPQVRRAAHFPPINHHGL
jgi:hypothetical protein